MKDREKVDLLDLAEKLTLDALLIVMSRDTALVPRVLAAFDGEFSQLASVKLPPELVGTRDLVFTRVGELIAAAPADQREIAVEISHLVLRLYLEILETKTERVALAR